MESAGASLTKAGPSLARLVNRWPLLAVQAQSQLLKKENSHTDDVESASPDYNA